ncbi:MAG: hypothetical protein HC911_17885 [Chloroflexaceae bacterium]|nr:hypothetical protein [Chloroflexaceae bacterium]
MRGTYSDTSVNVERVRSVALPVFVSETTDTIELDALHALLTPDEGLRQMQITDMETAGALRRLVGHLSSQNDPINDPVSDPVLIERNPESSMLALTLDETRVYCRADRQ